MSGAEIGAGGCKRKKGGRGGGRSAREVEHKKRKLNCEVENRSTERERGKRDLSFAMRRRRITLLSSLLIAAVLFFLASKARAELAQAVALPEQLQSTASSASSAESSSSHLSSSSSSFSSSPRPRRSLPLATSPYSHGRSLKCDPSMVSESAKAAFADVTDGGNDGGPELFRSLNSSTFSNSTASTGGAINDRCSQAEAIVEANSTEPLNNRMVFHARQWTEKEIIDTALRRRGARVAAGALTEYDLAAASPLLLPSIVRFRPLSDALLGNEVSRVMTVFSDGEIPENSTINGLPRTVARLETVVSSASGAKVRRTISPSGLSSMLAQPELVLLAMAAANRTLSPGTETAAREIRITKQEYVAFLTRDGQVDVCEDLSLPGDAAEPVDRLFAAADANEDGLIDASEIKRANLTDAATVWILAGDADGDGMLSAKELADGLPQYGDLQPRGGTQRASKEQLRRIRETAALAALAAYDVKGDGRLTIAEMRVYSSDFSRRSMGQTMVPLWAFSWHVAQIAVNDARESVYIEKEEAISRLTEWKGAEAAKAAAEQKEKQHKSSGKKSKPPAEAFPSLLTPRHINASALSNFTSSLYSSPSFDESAALRSFMLSHANFSMSARASLAAASAAGMSFASGSAADLAPGFDIWSRAPDPSLTQQEWVNFYSTVHKMGARAYWTIGKRAGSEAVAPECCGERAREREFCFSSILLSSGFSPLKVFRRRNSLFFFFFFLSLSSPQTNTQQQQHTKKKQASSPPGSSR